MQIDFLRVLQGEPEKQHEQDKSNDGGDEFHQRVLSGGSANMAVSHIRDDISKRWDAQPHHLSHPTVVPAQAGTPFCTRPEHPIAARCGNGVPACAGTTFSLRFRLRANKKNGIHGCRSWSARGRRLSR
jgi:hypothetical protein